MFLNLTEDYKMTVATKAKLKSTATEFIVIKGNPKAKLKTMKKFTFPLSFTPSKRDLNDLPIENILERDVGDYREKYVADLLSMIQSESNDAYHKGLVHYEKQNKKFYAKMYPKVAQVEIGKLKSDEDINRELDVGHATDIFVNYDEQR
jgi:hypothetical protein